MALGDFQMFRPSDSAYANPGELTESWRAMALERATESSNLERLYRTLEQEKSQFAQQLTEQQRQFDETLGFKERESEIQEEYLTGQLDLKEAELGLAAQQLGLEARKIGVFESEEDRAGKIDWIETGMKGTELLGKVYQGGRNWGWWGNQSSPDLSWMSGNWSPRP